MKQKNKIRIARFLTKFVKPCIHFDTASGVNKNQVLCKFDNSRRNHCKTVSCPHFRPTLRYRIARRLGMVR